VRLVERHTDTVDIATHCDYSGYMHVTLRDSKATLSALVEQAVRGDEVVITVHGTPKVRLCPIVTPYSEKPQAWFGELRELRAKWATKKNVRSADVLDPLREDRP
jgi:prevent-host-death family protein